MPSKRIEHRAILASLQRSQRFPLLSENVSSRKEPFKNDHFLNCDFSDIVDVVVVIVVVVVVVVIFVIVVVIVVVVNTTVAAAAIKTSKVTLTVVTRVSNETRISMRPSVSRNCLLRRKL